MTLLSECRFMSAAGILLVASALPGCATVKRPFVTELVARDAMVPDMPGVRFWGDMAAPADSVPIQSAAAVYVLALSGGADEGAYGAGFLNGWTRAGGRPNFDIVTGVSTGALIAPFAFLGSKYDAHLTRAFTTVDRHDIFTAHFPLAIPFETSLAKTKPLERLIARFYDDAAIEAVGAQHRLGRRLYVGTANLDAQRTVIWNMGAIAASRSVRRHALFRAVLLASSSIPAVFPPVFVDAISGGQAVRELHVDGGASAGLLAAPPSLDTRSPGGPGSKLYLLVNSRLGGDYQMVKNSIISITKRAFALSVQSALRDRTRTAYDWSQREGVDFNLSYIGADFGPGDKGIFDNAYMRLLYAYGEKRGVSARWDTKPPVGDVVGRADCNGQHLRTDIGRCSDLFRCSN